MRIFGFRSHGGPEVLELLDVPAPTPGPHQVLIDVLATAVNPGDLNTREGTNGWEVKFPMAFGREAAGRVVGTGELVFGSAASGHGTFGEQALLDAASVTPVPAGMDVRHAACLPVAWGTAYDALDMLDLPAGSQLLVLGAGGGVGTAITTLATARGLEVIGVASDAKKELVESLGARHVPKGQWAGERPAAVFDLVGGDTLREAAVLVPGARLVSVADKPLVEKLGGSAVPRRRTREVFEQVARQARVHVSAYYPLERAAEAVAAVEDGHATGKVVVTLD
ncbi:MAG TPA: zinc-binding dehydrogenase [Corynebacterium pollutisoli]|uniref:Zinc-binding dehydrogenase n=1 Tax=Corynebacterium pollutisoli TaxID=1610489 RepID=A0A7X8MX96_9CORY|nr:zinc-binding dehydrogenase [Corynebacterium pollutisoli]HJD78906.1 zinc-binding dehydrogenase [Corynebacterium pollutisoli]